MNQRTANTVLIAIAGIVLVGMGAYYVSAMIKPASVPVVAAPAQPVKGGVLATTTAVIPVKVIPAKPVTTPPSKPATASMITQADNGKTVVLTKGQRFGIAMGDTLQWDLAFDPDGIVTRVPNIATLRGEQGVYTATAAGTTTLHATGAPICNAGEACPMFLQAVTVTIVVK
ncbi:MAG: hypothetical protein JWL88_318 [Parcubacteria group bacterium]|nr:hypothetical protein [Parcubacteria group bacterium]